MKWDKMGCIRVLTHSHSTGMEVEPMRMESNAMECDDTSGRGCDTIRCDAIRYDMVERKAMASNERTNIVVMRRGAHREAKGNHAMP